MNRTACFVGFGLVVIACGGGGQKGFGDQSDVLPASKDPAGSPTSGLGSSGGGDGGEAAVSCTGLQCQQHACTGGGSTTVSGIVYDPAGKNPLYNVVVYVPNAAVAPLASGATCDTCDALYTGKPIASAVTDSAGRFTIKDVPDGTNIPLVIQIGKWRRQIKLANVMQCKDNPQPDKSLTLPKNHAEGDIPNIAISTGNADSLECLLRRVGLDASEYGGGSGGAGRIHVFQGGNALSGVINGVAPNTSPAAPYASAGLWSSLAELKKYDVVLLSCEGGETVSMNQGALFDYAKAGGRVFASHFHYAWFNSGPFGAANLASWLPTSQNIGDIKANIVTTLASGTPFTKGMALQQWLGNVGALTAGELPISHAAHNSDVTAAHVASQAWIKADSAASAPGATQYLTFNAPIGAAPANQCGRVVFSDIHVGAASGDYASGASTQAVPNGCGAGALSAQEKALEFMLFDLSSCVTPDDKPPPPPPPPVK